MNTIPIQQTFANRDVWEPLYRMHVLTEPFETELFQSAPLRRLKHLHHFGAGALFSPVTHSRYEHTVGVWALVKHFFPEYRELRAAAILHDIGHLPFSHSIEQALGASHHLLTEEAIASQTISTILRHHGLQPDRLIELLNEDTPLTHKTNFLGIDHLDSFLRDTYTAGCDTLHPAEVIRRIHFRGHVVETDENTAMQLLDAVVNDNLIFLQPHFLAMDDLLSRTVAMYCREHPSAKKAILRMTDAELLSLLQSSSSPDIRGALHVLLAEPHRIEPCDENCSGAYQVTVRKAYCKQPLVRGLPLSEVNPAAKESLHRIAGLAGTYYYRINL